jgi:hypothetical protein
MSEREYAVAQLVGRTPAGLGPPGPPTGPRAPRPPAQALSAESRARRQTAAAALCAAQVSSVAVTCASTQEKRFGVFRFILEHSTSSVPLRSRFSLIPGGSRLGLLRSLPSLGERADRHGSAGAVRPDAPRPPPRLETAPLGGLVRCKSGVNQV